MATWVPIPASGYPKIATQPIASVLPVASNPINNGPPRWLPAPGFFTLINTTTGHAI